MGSFRMPFASVIPQIHGQHHGVDWNGGVLAIYENASEVQLFSLFFFFRTDVLIFLFLLLQIR